MANTNELTPGPDHQWKQIKYLRAQGTEAFCAGDISSASRFFSEALQIDAGLDEELKRKSQTEVQTLKSNAVKERNTFDKTGILSVLDTASHRATQSIKTNPECPKAYLAKGAVLLLQDKWEEARGTYIEGINSCDDSTALRVVLEKLKRTQRLLHSVPPQFQDSDSSTEDRNHKRCNGPVRNQTNPRTNVQREETGYSPRTSRSRKFRLQFRKKLSNDPARVFVDKTSPRS